MFYLIPMPFAAGTVFAIISIAATNTVFGSVMGWEE
jgi:hypothetical protein